MIEQMVRSAATRMFAGTLMSVAIICPGCSKQDPVPEVVTLEGKIESIDRSSDRMGVITVQYYNEKHNQEMFGTGEVTEETEILIDGAAATLADLREGDQVRGEVRVEKKNGKRMQTAIRIQVERPVAASER